MHNDGQEEENKSEIFSKITLVDLAGSERNYETVKFSGNEHKESADINMSLMALKNCFRAYSKLLQLKNQHNSVNSGGQAPLCELHKGSERLQNGHPTAPVSLGEYLGRKAAAGEEDLSSKSLGGKNSVRIPYRETLLTRVLKDCFTVPSSGGVGTAREHRTTIVATVSPTSTDLVHSVNTLDHVVKMAPQLQALLQSVTVEVLNQFDHPHDQY